MDRKPPRHARHSIVCDECHQRASVPFRPIAGRPVFCGACHKARKGSIERATDGLAARDDDFGIVE